MLRSSVLGSLALVTLGCGGSAVRGSDSVPSRPTVTVLVLGEAAHQVGRELGRDAHGRVHIALHEGPTLWVEAARVRPEAIAVGDPVVVRWDATTAAWEAEVIERHDRLLRLRFSDASVHLVSLGSVLAVLAGPLSSGAVVADDGGGHGDVPADTGPPPDPARHVMWPGLVDWVPARAVRCDDGVTVLLNDGTTATVPEADVSAAALEPGGRVAVRYQGGALSYLATVLEASPEGANVRYDDGTEEVIGLDLVTHVILPEDARAAQPRGTLCRRLTARQVPRVVVRRARVWRAGTLEGCGDDGMARVTDRTGETFERRLTELRRVAVAPGHGVLVPWGTEQYLATVQTVTGAELAIRYEDGEEATVTTGDVRMVLVPIADLASDGERPTCP